MKNLVILDVKDENSVKKLQTIEGEIFVLIGFRYKDNLVPSLEEYKSVHIKDVVLEDFDKKIWIKSSNEDFNKSISLLLQHFPDNKSKYIPSLWRKDHKTDETLDDIDVIFKQSKKTDVQRYILEFTTDEQLRFLDRSKIKLYIQRAFIRINLEARTKKTLFTDQFRFQNWTFGKDYCIGQLTENVIGKEQEILEGLKENLDWLGIHPVRFEVYSMNLKPANVFEKVVYEIQTDFDFGKVQSEINSFLEVDEFLVKIKVPGMMQDSWVTKEVNAKNYISDLWAEQIESDKGLLTVIRLISTDNIGMYELLPSLLHTSAKNVKRFPVKRIEYLKAENEAEFDLFAETCEVCGRQIEKNIFDEPISQNKCARHKEYITQVSELGADFDDQADQEASSIEAQEGLYLDSDGDVFDNEMLDEA